MTTVHVRFVGPDAVELDLTSVDSDLPALRSVVQPGDVIEVPYEIAHGSEGTVVVDENGEPVLDPVLGEPVRVNHYGGLLDQLAKWQLAKAPKTRAKSPAPDDPADDQVVADKED